MIDNVPSITVITVTFRESLPRIRRTLKSIFEQEYARDKIEVILKNGDPDDSSVSDLILNEFGDWLKNIELLESHDSGVYFAMNEAAKIASHDWIVFLNVGDIFASSTVFKDLIPKLSQYPSNEPVIACGSCIYKNEVILPPVHLSPYFLYFKTICHQSIVCSRSIFSQYGQLFNTKYTIVSDRIWLLSCLRLRFRCLMINLVICDYEYSNSSVSADLPLALNEMKHFKKSFFSRTENILFMPLSIFNRGISRICRPIQKITTFFLAQ